MSAGDRHPLRQLSHAELEAALDGLGLDKDLLPYDSSPAERLAAQNPGLPPQKVVPMEPVAPPNGTPVMPSWIGPLASAVGAVALALTQILPPHTVGYTIAGAVLSLAGLFGPISAGWRK